MIVLLLQFKSLTFNKRLNLVPRCTNMHLEGVVRPMTTGGLLLIVFRRNCVCLAGLLLSLKRAANKFDAGGQWP